MQQTLAQRIQEQEIATALVIDDAFDAPVSRDIVDTAESFLEALPKGGLATVGGLLGRSDLTPDSFLTLIEQDDTAAALYEHRAKIPSQAATVLFQDYETSKAEKQAEIAYITEMLRNVGLDVVTQGSTPSGNGQSADIIVIDLFFHKGLSGEEAAADAANRLGHYLPDRSEPDTNVPLVILVSSQEPDLNRVFSQFRDEAALPGCRFTFMKKKIFRTDPNEAIFRILQLVRTNRESQIFESVIRRLELASNQATERFLKKLRQFELSDYADLSKLIVDAEGGTLSQYLLELYALAWASFAEAGEETVAALAQLEGLGLNVENYPPNAFVPSPAVLELYESALYRPSNALTRLEDFDHLALGDILVQRDQQSGQLLVRLVIVQDCDMARGGRPDAAFLIPGELKDAKEARAISDRFPLTIDGRQYSVSWNNKHWTALRQGDFENEVIDKGVERIMRLRSPWATIRQLEFFRRLSRQAAMAAPHQIDAVDIEFLLMNSQSRAMRVRDFSGEPAAYLLHGRDDDGPLIRLVLSQSCATELRERLSEAAKDEANYREDMRTWLRELLADADRLQSLHSHLCVEANKATKQPAPNEDVGVALKQEKHYADGANANQLRIMINAKLISDADDNL